MLRHVDPPTVVRRVVVDRAACERHSSLGRALRRRARSAPPRAEAAQAREAEGRVHSQGRVGMGVGPRPTTKLQLQRLTSGEAPLKRLRPEEGN